MNFTKIKKTFITVLLAAFLLSSISIAQELNTIEIDNSAGLPDYQLKIWNDQDFQKQFIQSYIAETEIEPRVTIDEREQMQKILELISGDKMPQAIDMLKKYINPAASAVFDFTLANIYFQQENFEQAAVSYKTAVEKYPKFRRAWRNLGLIYIRQSDFANALPAFTKVIEFGGGDAITYGLLGFAYSSVGNHLSGESAYRMAILLDPITTDWQLGLARSFFKQQRYAEAAAICQQLIEKYPDKADFWLLQANAYIGLNQTNKAAQIYEFIDTLGKSTPESLNMLADIYINQELYDLAVDKYIEAIKKSSQAKPDRAIRSAKVLVARGALSQTKKIIEQIDNIFGNSIDDKSRKDLLKIKARLAVADGSGEEEVKVLEQIVALDPLDGEALILLGQHCRNNGQDDKAIFYFERAASLEQYEADAKVRHAQLLVSKGKYTEALPLLRRAQMIKPRENIQKYLEQVERISKTQ